MTLRLLILTFVYVWGEIIESLSQDKGAAKVDVLVENNFTFNLFHVQLSRPIECITRLRTSMYVNMNR